MAAIKPIRTDGDLEHALERIDQIFDAKKGTPESDELDVLTVLVEHYENQGHPIGLPTPVAAIEFRMEQAGLTNRDLIPFMGSRSRVSEVLSGKRAITMSMARALHRHLGIPAEVLLQEPGAKFDSAYEDLEPERFPLKAMARAGWIPDLPDLKDRAEELIRGLIERAGGPQVAAAPLYRKNDQRRMNAKTDDYALRAWCWQVMAAAQENPPPAAYRQGTVSPEFLRSLAQLSASRRGPRRVRDFLADNGIGFQFVRHLPRTHLDGAAIKLHDGRPVIGMTLRYDRIDNFWYTLMHELAHVGLHFDNDGEDTAFVDDHSLRGVETAVVDVREAQADRMAEDALIPPDVWKDGAILDRPNAMAVLDLAAEANVHPAIVAGRVRHNLGNYRLLSQFVGTRQVRKHFATP